LKPIIETNLKIKIKVSETLVVDTATKLRNDSNTVSYSTKCGDITNSGRPFKYLASDKTIWKVPANKRTTSPPSTDDSSYLGSGWKTGSVNGVDKHLIVDTG
jgi:hypothetical protein